MVYTIGMKTKRKLLTVGEIAAALGVAVHRVNYILATKMIEPDARVGRYRLFHHTVVADVRRELARRP